jgi:hypothetical protein
MFLMGVCSMYERPPRHASLSIIVIETCPLGTPRVNSNFGGHSGRDAIFR